MASAVKVALMAIARSSLDIKFHYVSTTGFRTANGRFRRIHRLGSFQKAPIPESEAVTSRVARSNTYYKDDATRHPAAATALLHGLDSSPVLRHRNFER